MNKVIRVLLSLPVAVMFTALLLINLKLHYTPQIKIVGSDTLNFDLIKELHGLKKAMHNNADMDMQRLYPEGYIFMNALYSLAWINTITKINRASAIYKEGYNEIKTSINKIHSNEGRAAFTKDMSLPYGAFYAGWSCYVLGKKLTLDSLQNRSEQEVAQFKRECATIATAIQEHTYPASYYGSAWPADASVCVASLSLYDKIFPAAYTNTIKTWLVEVNASLDSTGMIAHEVSAQKGIPIANSRGSSMGLMLMFLKDIDSDFANQQFKTYKEKFMDSRFGLLGIREYTAGDYGIGDVDSGPVVLQMGSSATLVGMGTLALYGDQNNSVAIRNVIEAFGFPMERNECKTYLFNALPIADCFIAWAHSVMKPDVQSTSSFLSFHLYSIGFSLLLIIIIWYIWRPRKPSSEKSLHIPW